MGNGRRKSGPGSESHWDLRRFCGNQSIRSLLPSTLLPRLFSFGGRPGFPASLLPSGGYQEKGRTRSGPGKSAGIGGTRALGIEKGTESRGSSEGKPGDSKDPREGLRRGEVESGLALGFFSLIRFLPPQPAARGLHGAGERERLSGYLLPALQQLRGGPRGGARARRRGGAVRAVYGEPGRLPHLQRQPRLQALGVQPTARPPQPHQVLGEVPALQRLLSGLRVPRRPRVLLHL